MLWVVRSPASMRRAAGEGVDPLRLRVDLFAERLDGALDRPDGVHQILLMGVLLAVVFVLDRLDAEDALEPVHEGGVRPVDDDVDDVEAADDADDETGSTIAGERSGVNDATASAQ